MPPSRRQKRYLEKRRRTRRKQHGGAIANIDDWIAAVAASPAFRSNKEDKYRPNEQRELDYILGQYQLSDLKDPSLLLPDIEDGRRLDSNFDINRFTGSGAPSDLRKEGARASIIMRDMIAQNLTPAGFKTSIDLLKEEMVSAPDIYQSLSKLAQLEHKLRKRGIPNNKNDALKILEDRASYPLYIWALVMNLPEKPIDAEPDLMSVEEVAKELASPEVQAI